MMNKIKMGTDSEATWIETINLGVLGNFNTIIINLDGCEVAGVRDDMATEEKLEKATLYYVDRFKKLEADAEVISEQFLMWIITHLCDIGYPFWEFGEEEKHTNKYPDYIVVEEMQKFEDEHGQFIHDPNSSSPIYQQLYEYDAYSNRDQLSSFEIVEKYLPMLDFRKLVNTIHADSLDTFEEYIHFQVSSEVCGGMLLCATYGTIYPNHELEVTNNC